MANNREVVCREGVCMFWGCWRRSKLIKHWGFCCCLQSINLKYVPRSNNIKQISLWQMRYWFSVKTHAGHPDHLLLHMSRQSGHTRASFLCYRFLEGMCCFCSRCLISSHVQVLQEGCGDSIWFLLRSFCLFLGLLRRIFFSQNDQKSHLECWRKFTWTVLYCCNLFREV